MLAAIAGGNLQGVEASYLARKAGWRVLLLDKDAHATASGLCDHFIRLDVRDRSDLLKSLRGVDLLIPAMENDEALASLASGARSAGVPFAFDQKAYAVSSSKIASDQFFEHAGIPIPEPWPKCPLPVVVKPSRASGSAGVRIFHDQEMLTAFLDQADGEWVVQAYIEGPTYSLEIMGSQGRYQTLQVTDLYMDSAYDCRKVTAPSCLPQGLQKQFEAIALEAAQQLNLNGLMDVEAVLDNDALRVLEIDARLPSQTPTAVYHSCGFNMLAAIGDLFLADGQNHEIDLGLPKTVSYEHIRVSHKGIEFAGEHIMSKVGPLQLIDNFFGADEAITNYQSGCPEWVATLIISAADRLGMEQKREQVLENLRRNFP